MIMRTKSVLLNILNLNSLKKSKSMKDIIKDWEGLKEALRGHKQKMIQTGEGDPKSFVSRYMAKAKELLNEPTSEEFSELYSFLTRDKSKDALVFENLRLVPIVKGWTSEELLPIMSNLEFPDVKTFWILSENLEKVATFWPGYKLINFYDPSSMILRSFVWKRVESAYSVSTICLMIQDHKPFGDGACFIALKPKF